MDLPRRKRTRLPAHDYSSAGAYFITICTQDRKNLLGRIVGGGALDAPQTCLYRIGQIVEKRILSGNQIPGIRVDKYVIMPNHIHMILFVDHKVERSDASRANARVPQFVSSLKGLCHKDAGIQFFQRSYHDHVIRGETDYQKIWQYIDCNPALWDKDCFFQE